MTGRKKWKAGIFWALVSPWVCLGGGGGHSFGQGHNSNLFGDNIKKNLWHKTFTAGEHYFNPFHCNREVKIFNMKDDY